MFQIKKKTANIWNTKLAIIPIFTILYVVKNPTSSVK